MLFVVTTASSDSAQLWGVSLEYASLVIALLAVGVAAWSAWYTVRVTRETTRHSHESTREAATTETYQRIHEALVDPKAASGRRRLFIAARIQEFPQLGEPGWDEINYALALYDTLGGYIFHGMIDEKVALGAWHHPLQEIRSPVHSFMEHRSANGISQPWSFLLHLLERAEQYQCDCPGQAR